MVEPTPQSTNSRRFRRGLIAAIVVALATGVGYMIWPARPPSVPEIPTAGLDSEVAAVITKAREEVEKDPEAADAWGKLGMVLFAHNHYVESVPIFITAERLNPRDPRWPYLHGLAVILENPAAGIEALERAAQLPPRSFAVRLRLAEETLRLNALDRAESLFRELQREELDHARIALGLAQIQFARGDYGNALQAFARIADDPTTAKSARVALAALYSRLGQADKADAEGQRAAELAPDQVWPDPILLQVERWQTGLQARIDLALNLLHRGELEEAKSIVDAVVRAHPRSDEAQLTLAKVCIRRGEHDRAEIALQKALELNPRLAEAHFLHAGIHMLRKHYSAAERSYLKAVEHKPTYGLAFLQLGNCQKSLQRPADAIAAYRAAVRCRPDLAAAHLELGALLLDQTDARQAIVHLEHAIRLGERSDRAKTLLATARSQHKN